MQKQVKVFEQNSPPDQKEPKPTRKQYQEPRYFSSIIDLQTTLLIRMKETIFCSKTFSVRICPKDENRLVGESFGADVSGKQQMNELRLRGLEESSEGLMGSHNREYE